MAKIFTTEITSENIPSDNPIHQRLFKAYVAAEGYIKGEVLEVGCGEGRGVEILIKQATQLTAVDKLESALQVLRERFPATTFKRMDLPPFAGLSDNAFDCVVSFQVIEHIEDDVFFLKEIYRVLKPGGVALLTTPNRKQSLSRNPWHIREYLSSELELLASGIFKSVEMKGITGNEKVMAYHEKNKKSVDRIMRWDILNLQHRLPAWVLRTPYELLNRMNRNTLKKNNDHLVSEISESDYMVTEDATNALDLFLIVRK